MTTFRKFEAQEFASVATIVTTDFEALYAYKRGDYQQCLQLSTQNVHTLIDGINEVVSHVLTRSEFIQLMDDHLVCFVGLTLLVDSSFREEKNHVIISQLSLALYLMTQCQIKLHHPVTSLAQTLDYIEVAHRKLGQEFPLNHLLLKLTEQKILRYTYQPDSRNVTTCSFYGL